MTFEDLFRTKAEAWLERMSMNAKKQELLRAVRLPKLYRADADSILQMSCPNVTSVLEQSELKEVLDSVRRASSNKGKGRGAYRAETKTRILEATWKLMFVDDALGRLRILLSMDAWPHIVEAMYRYEHKAELSYNLPNAEFGHFSASERAHWKVADAVNHDNIKTIERWCQTARDERRAGDDQDITPFPVTHFLQWLREGGSLLSSWGEASD